MKNLSVSQIETLRSFAIKAKELLKNYVQPKVLLSNGSTNAKTYKNATRTFILYCLPWKFNSKQINLCAKASEGCSLGCLVFAGRGKFTSVMKARLFKSEFYIRARAAFIELLKEEVLRKAATARRKGERILFRLNGTTDLDFIAQLKKSGLDVSGLQDVADFYDYTALLGKAMKYYDMPNVTHAFSRKENNDEECIKALSSDRPVPVAAVFHPVLPKTWNGFPVVNGDEADDIMIKYRNQAVVLGLLAKGDAKKDKTGFVIRVKNAA